MITDTDGRKVSAFQFHLQGPANTWFSCLEEDDKADWDNLVAAFELSYCVENNKSVLLVDLWGQKKSRIQLSYLINKLRTIIVRF